MIRIICPCPSLIPAFVQSSSPLIIRSLLLPTYCLDRSEDHQHRDQQEHPQQHSDVVCVGNLFNIIAEQHLITTFVNLLASSSSSSCASAYIYFLCWAFIFSTYCLPTFSPHCTIHCTLALHFLTRPPPFQPFGNSKRHGALAMALQKLGYNCTFARAVILFLLLLLFNPQIAGTDTQQHTLGHRRGHSCWPAGIIYICTKIIISRWASQ